MNKWTLTFKSPELEASFQVYLRKQSQARIVQLMALSGVLSLALAICSLFSTNYVLGGMYFAWVVISGLITFTVYQNAHYTYYFQKMLTCSSFYTPYILYSLIVSTDYLSLPEILCSWWTMHLTVHYFIMYQNFVLNTIIYLNLMVVSCLILYSIVGFYYYEIIYAIYSLFWLHIEYVRIWEKRKQYSESQINQSMLNIMDKSINDKLIVFSYDEDNLKFDYLLCNNTAKQYIEEQMQQYPEGNENEIKLNNSSLISYILKQIIIPLNQKRLNLGQQITDLYLKNKEFNLPSLFKGYYISKHNKISVEVNVYRQPKFLFTVNLQTRGLSINADKKISSQQSQFITKYQHITSNFVNQIDNCLGQQYSSSKKILSDLKQQLNAYHVRLKIINIQYSITYSYTIQQFDLVDIIKLAALNNRIKYNLQDDQIMINSDMSLCKLLFEIMFMYIKLQKQHDILVIIKTHQSNTHLTLSFGDIKNAIHQQKAMKKLIHLLIHLLQHIGDPNAINIMEYSLEISLLLDLETSFLRAAQ